MGTDEKEMNMKNEPFPRLHCQLLESLLLKVMEMSACCACLVVEMVMAVVGMLPECGIGLLWKDCPHDPLQRHFRLYNVSCGEPMIPQSIALIAIAVIFCRMVSCFFVALGGKDSAAWLRVS